MLFPVYDEWDHDFPFLRLLPYGYFISLPQEPRKHKPLFSRYDGQVMTTQSSMPGVLMPESTRPTVTTVELVTVPEIGTFTAKHPPYVVLLLVRELARV